MTKSNLVLIVEDSATQAQKVATMIKLISGLNVIVATNGLEALRTAESCQPDAIILDVNLPDMDGYQVCKRLKRDQKTAHIPVVILSSDDSAQAAIDGLDAGAADYIPKDVFATDNLMATLRNFINFK
jgi:DNA-binding response OmpR family regulator